MKNFILLLFVLFQVQAIFSQSPTRLDSLELALQEAATDSQRLAIVRQITTMVFRKDIAKQLAYAEKIVDLSKRMNDVENEIIGLYYQGVGYVYTSDYEKAKNYAHRGLGLANAITDDKKIVMFQSLLGSIYRETNQLDSALYYLFESAASSERLGDKTQLAFNYNGIANLYMYQQDTTKGREYFIKTKNIHEETGNLEGLGQAYNNLSTIETDRDTSIYYLEKAKKLFEQSNSIYGLSLVYPNLGKEYTERQEYDKALEYLMQGKEFLENGPQQFKPNLAAIYRNLGLVNAAKGNTREGIKWYNQAVQLSKELDDHFYLANTYSQISDLYEKSGNAVEGLRYYKLSVEEKDLLVDETKTKQTIESETRYQTAQKEKEIAEQQLEIERKDKQQNLIIFIASFLILGLFGLFQLFRYRQRIKRKETELALELEHAEANKLRELDQLKSRFFANISHEFRTPLTLIKGPLRDIREGRLEGEQQKYFGIMERNTDRLLKLVNQVLDLSKLESGNISLDTQSADLFKFISAIANSFESLAQRKQINFNIETPAQGTIALFDEDKLEKIITNLLSNAFKFTPEEGEVNIIARLSSANDGNSKLELVVNDSGFGISENQLPYIFDRFYQNPEAPETEFGTGIGLTLSKELVELMGGEILVESKIGQGTTFKVLLPIKVLEKAVKEITGESLETKEQFQKLGENVSSPAKKSNKAGNLPIVLVVEDNDDVRTYIKDQLIGDYHLEEAINGKLGLEKAAAVLPDLIISDVMMPQMDGIEMCNLLKKNTLTSHIPIIMLTAKAEREDKLSGLETGAEDYLIKPFDTKELQLKVRNLIEQRQKLKERFRSDFNFKPGEVTVTSMDEDFLMKVKKSVEDNLDDETFSVVELSKAVNMSRSQLHRKLTSITGQSPNKIIREMRLIRAKELLEKQAGNASEVAFMVGFNSPAYFTRCFSDYFGKNPSEVLKEKA